MHTQGKESKDTNTKALEKELAKALAALKPFFLKSSWVKFPKKDSEIGVGGFGVVHRAVLQKGPFSPKIHVAVKKFHTIGQREELLRVALALIQELNVWAKLDHPNILPLVGFNLSSSLEQAWLVSPYATNGNLFEYLEQTQPGLDKRLELAKDTAKGLEYLHTRTPPICHGDIKSLNILIHGSGHAMLCDFGLAKATDASAVSTKSSSMNDGGTIRYWSPELFEDDSHPTLESDVWAWGCLLLEIVTGLPPYHDVTLEGRLIHVITNGTLPATLDDDTPCPPHIRDLLQSCWETQPGSRPTMVQSLASLTVGNIKFYRSESSLPTPSSSSSALDSLERELTEVLSPLEQFRIDPAWFDFPKFGSAIGFGGFGIVHRVEMRKTWQIRGVVVAVKKLRAIGGKDKRLRMVTALIREVAVWATLSHPNIIPFLGFYLSPQLEEAWLVAPFMKNGNLNQYIRGANLGINKRLMLALDTAKGLQYLHNHNPPICHGDIKGLNVLINAEHRAVFCDFGLAKTMENMPSGLTTSTFNQAGSLPYESPELLLGKSLRALESDVWAWGCLLQEIFSGKTPYHWANNPGAIVKWITQDIPPAVLEEIECTSFVRRLLGCCWQSQTDFRPSMDQCVTILTDQLSNLSDDRNARNALSVLEELEDKIGIISIKDLMVKRPHLNFSKDTMIGSGSLGATYKGQLSTEPSLLGTVVTIKQLLPPSSMTNIPLGVVQSIVRQLQAKHENILQIIGYCDDPSPTGELLLVFPYLARGSLNIYLEHNTLNDMKKVALATEIAEAMLYLHTRSPPIIHGRLHPQNILINDGGHPLLSDYGFNEFLSSFKQFPATIESICYQSPESLTVPSSGTLRGDVWSWGCILLLIISGQAPYSNISTVDSFYQQLEEKTSPTLLDDLNCDSRTINLLGMCWAWKPSSRLPMSEVVAILTGKPFLFTQVWSVRVKDFKGLRFSRGGEFLAIRQPSSTRVYNTYTGDLAYELTLLSTTGRLGRMEFSWSEQLLAEIQDTNVVVWNLTTQTVQKTLSFSLSDLWAINISFDDTFCVGCCKSNVYIWDISNRGQNHSISLSDKLLRTIAISPACDVLAVGGADTGIYILGVQNLNTIAQFTFSHTQVVRFSPSGHSLFACCTLDQTIKYWNTADFKKSGDSGKSIMGVEFKGLDGWGVTVSGGSTWLMSLTREGTVYAVNFVTEQAGGKSQHVGSMFHLPFNFEYMQDLGPVSEEGTGYTASHSENSNEVAIWKYASLSYQHAYQF